MSESAVVAGNAADPAVILPGKPPAVVAGAAARSSSREQQNVVADETSSSSHRDTIIKKYGLEDIVPRESDYEVGRANLMPTDGSTPIFAGGRPINSRRRESSSPAVVEALNRGFKLAHYPARALLPEDMFSKGLASNKTSKVQNHYSTTTSPEPNAPRTAGRSSQASSHHHGPRHTPAAATSNTSSHSTPYPAHHHHHHHARGADPTDPRIPGDISPHVLPHAMMLKKIAPARELLESEVPLHENPRYGAQERAHHAQMQLASFTHGDPEYICGLAKHFRRCYPRTEKDDLHDDLPTSSFSGNYILRRYGGCFPQHCHYNFYRKYSEFGLGAATSEFHNFPAGRHPLADN